MGVRGTDFFVAAGSDEKEAEFSILRGAVEVKSEEKNAKPVAVNAGESAAVTQKVETHAPVVELRKTTQEDLVAIQKASKIEAPKAAPVTTQKEIAQLEKKAVETTIQDVRAHNPKLADELSKEMKSGNTEAAAISEKINSQTIAVAMKSAPQAPAHHKPFTSEIEDLEAGAYQRYFKAVE